MSDIIKNRDIVIVGQQAWDVEIGSNCKNIALEFSKNNRVLYVNAPLDTQTYLKGKSDANVKKRIDLIEGKKDNIFKIENNLWNLYPDKIIRSINWLPFTLVHTIINKANNKLFAESISKAIDTLGFKDIILFNDNDIIRSFYLKDFLKPKVSVYYSRDYMLGVDYWKRHGERLEPKLIAKSDVCVANSVYLANYCKQYNPNSYYVGQGCDLEMFVAKDQVVPNDVAHIKRPVIGYVGALQSLRLDIDLLKHIAQKRPDWSIVLVGPEDNEFITSDLHQLENVHFLGRKNGDQLPAYISSFDVCINPQIVNQVTIGNYPRKIDEYLAMGKPTVATYTEAMSVFADHVYLGKGKEDYIALIQKALNEDSPEKQQERIDFASGHTWENNVKEIYAAINAVQQ